MQSASSSIDAAAGCASNLPAVGLMILAALHFSRRMPEQAGFSAAMLLLYLVAAGSSGRIR